MLSVRAPHTQAPPAPLSFCQRQGCSGNKSRAPMRPCHARPPGPELNCQAVWRHSDCWQSLGETAQGRK